MTDNARDKEAALLECCVDECHYRPFCPFFRPPIIMSDNPLFKRIAGQ